MTFRVGQKVVCVGEINCSLPYTPQLGRVYEIRGFVSYGEHVGLYLRELVNPPRPTPLGQMEQGFISTKFRPIVNTNISIFTKMLTDKTVEVVR